MTSDAQPHTAAVTGNPTVAVIVPTKNRPDLLEQALTSVTGQTLQPSEIIVVDDGSTPPVDSDALRARHGPNVRVLRNETSMGLAFSRHRGVDEAGAEHILHLDDDDLLAPDALAQCVAALQANPDVQLLFFSAQGFAERATHFNAVQPEGVRRVCSEAAASERAGGVLVFDRRLFPVLLRTVPVAFQRVFATREICLAVTRLRWRVYMQDPAVPDAATALRVINGTLRDSEWARYAAALCQRTALIDQPLYLVRCSGQGYSSVPDNKPMHAMQQLSILRAMQRGASGIDELTTWQSDVRTALARALFDMAYGFVQGGDGRLALPFLVEAMRTDLQLRQLKLALRMLLGKFLAP
jgi:hypothetical protein